MLIARGSRLIDRMMGTVASNYAAMSNERVKKIRFKNSLTSSNIGLSL